MKSVLIPGPHNVIFFLSAAAGGAAHIAHHSDPIIIRQSGTWVRPRVWGRVSTSCCLHGSIATWVWLYYIPSKSPCPYVFPLTTPLIASRLDAARPAFKGC